MSFIDYDKSLDLLLQDVVTLGSEKVFLSDSINRVLAEDLIAPYSSPSYPTSAMDGYAVKFEDLELASIDIIDINPAGSIVSNRVDKGVCIKTFTGSLMPQGSDTLIPIENVTVENSKIIINQKVPFGFSVRAVGENFSKGDILLKKGDVIGFAHIGVMASMNIVNVLVEIQPTVATLSTGSEILDLGEEQSNDAQIRSSNHLTIAAIASSNGAKIRQLGVVSDDKANITKVLKEALKSADIIVTTGGVSVGDYDFVKDIIKDELGAKLLFKGVAIKPGRHIMVAKVNNRYIIGLPGFAYSSTVTSLLYVVPLIKAMQNSATASVIVKARLKEDYKKRSKFTEFTACNLSYEDGEYLVDFEGKKTGSSAILTNMLGNTALLKLSSSAQDMRQNDIVDVLKI